MLQRKIFIMKYAWLTCLFLLILFAPDHLLAQEIPTRHFTMKDGLPSMGIRCVFKDSRGLIWIGTDGGLCKYDGKTFKILKASDGMTASKIWSIAEDEKGNLWFGSFGNGLFKYDGQHFEQFTKKDGLVDDWVRVICYSKNFHCLIAGSNDGISTIRGKSISRSPKYLASQRPDYCITGIADAGKFIYITTYAGNNPIRYFPDQNKFISANDSGVKYPEYSFGCYISSRGDTVFEAGSLGVRIINKDTVVNNKTLGQVFGYTEDNEGNLWFAAWSYTLKQLEGGIYKYDGKTFRNYKSAFGITDLEIWSVFFDKEQEILWVGTLNEGLYMIPYSVFSEYDASFFNVNKLKINSVYVDNDNSVWIADQSNLIKKRSDESYSVLDNHQMRQACLKVLQKNYKTVISSGNQNLIELLKSDNSRTSSIRDWDELNYRHTSEDKDHSMLFLNKFGLFSFDQDKENINYLCTDLPDNIAFSEYDTLIKAGWGPTRVCLKYRDFAINVQADPEKLFKNNPLPKNVNRIIIHNSRVWYASWSDGLWMSEGLKFTSFNKTDGSISNDLTDICFDNENHIIFGSNTGEIYIASYSGNKLKIGYRINSNQGLQGNSISWLMTDKKGSLWAGTNLGINRIDLTKLYQTGKCNISFFDDEEGYCGQSAKRVAMDNVGNLWIGSDDRLIKMELPRVNSFHADPGKIILEDLEINNLSHEHVVDQDIDPWTMLPKGKFTLHYTENSLVFFFDKYNFLNPTKDRFRFFLKGYDTKWSDWSAVRRAVYTNLPPGSYTFSVESYNINTGTKVQPLKIEFRIMSPWWRLWYLQAALTIMAITIILFAIRKKITQVKFQERQKSEIEKKIAQLEIQALQAQMNPHFIFNAINSIQYFVLSNKTDEVLSYLSDFSKVVRSSLDNVSKKMAPLDQEIDFLKSYLRIEKMRFPNKFSFSFKILGELDPKAILIPPFLIQPYVENAVRHGIMHKSTPGHLLITFEDADNELLKCTVTDDGVGRKKAMEIEGTSAEPARPHSTEITETRIRLFNQPDQSAKCRVVYTDCFDKEGNACGLKVEVYIPMDNS